MINYIHVPITNSFFTLTPAARLVWMGLCSFASWKDGCFSRCFPGNAALVDRTGLSRSTIKRALHELIEKGFIVRQLRLKGKLHLTSECLLGPVWTTGVGPEETGVGPEETGVGPEETDSRSAMDPDHYHNHYQNMNSEQGEEADPPQLPEIIKLWNDILGPLGFSIHAVVLGGTRAKALRQRMEENPERRTIAWWEGLFRRIAETPFLIRKGQNWLTLDWLLCRENLAKILEGKYERDYEFKFKNKKTVHSINVENFVKTLMDKDPFWGGDDDDCKR